MLTFIAAVAVASCKTDMDCSLAGACDAGTGKCACEPWTKGEDCAALNLVPLKSNASFASIVSNAVEQNWTNWGGSVAFEGGQYHLFAAEMANHCGLGVWGYKSQVIHAVSDNALGPFIRRGIAISTEAHNPVLTQALDGTWLIFTCGCPHKYADATCDRVELICPGGAEAAWTTTLYSATSLDGPWTAHVNVLGNATRGRLGSQNVAPIVNADGSVDLMFKGPDNNTEASIVHAPHWSGPYSLIAVNIFGKFVADNITNEDVWWWRSQDGNYHALSHRMTPADRETPKSGGHSFSRSLATGWVESTTPAYETILDVEGGGTLPIARRERPQLLRDGKTGAPRILFNAVSPLGTGATPFTFAQLLGGVAE